MPDTEISAPVAYTLDSHSLGARFDQIADLNRRAMLASERDDLRLTLTYDRCAIDEVRRIVTAEEACCAFLDFAVIELTNTAAVTVTAPEDSRDAAETLLAALTSRVDSKRAAAAMSSGCCW